MQTYKYDSFADCIRHTYKTEKWRGFFRGVTAPMASVTLVRTISFSVYQRSKYTYAAWFKRNFGVDPLVHVNTPGTYPTFSTVACFGAAGATAGSFITLVACELKLARIYAMSTNPQRSFRIDQAQCSSFGSYGRSKSFQRFRASHRQDYCRCFKLSEQGHIQNSEEHREAPWFHGAVFWLQSASA